MHDDRAQAVPVRGDEHILAGAQVRYDVAVEVRQRARRSVLQAFTAGRRNVPAAPPQVYLLLAELRGGLSLVQTLQVTVVSLVQRLVVLDRQVRLADDRKDDL